MITASHITLKGLKQLNNDPEFNEFRQQNLKGILVVLTILGIIFVNIWHIFDVSTPTQYLDRILWLRIITSVFYIVNIILVLRFPKEIPIRIPIYLGFYAGTIFSLMLSWLTGGIMSVYYVQLEFLLLVWMVLIPFSYAELTVNGIVFILIYTIPLIITGSVEIDHDLLFQYGLLLVSTLLVGAIVAFFNNRFAAGVFLTEKKTKESEERFRLFNENVHDVIWAMDMDTLKFTYVSPSVYNLRGYHPEEVIDQTVEESLTPASAEKARHLLQQAVHRYNSGDRSGVMIGELEQYCKDGSTIWIEVVGTFLTNAKGEITQMLGDTRNITQRKRMEEALKKSEERYRLLIGSLQEGLFVIQDGKFTFLNDSIVEIVGYSVEELTGMDFLTVIAPEAREEVRSLNIARIAGDIVRSNYESMLLKKDGITRVPVIISVTRSEFEGQPATIGTAKDITQLKKTEEELRRAQEILRSESMQLQKENLRSQYETLKNQVNPHFLFNSLNVLTSLIRLDPDLAEKFAEQMSKVYRYVLEHREEDLVLLSSEVDFMRSYIFLLEIRFMDKIKLSLNIPDFRMEMKVPPLAAQLLIENAVKHNIFSKKQPLVIDIFIDGDGYLNIINNLQKRALTITSTGIGLVNIEARFGHLTDKPVFFGEVGDKFVARIPLLQ